MRMAPKADSKWKYVKMTVCDSSKWLSRDNLGRDLRIGCHLSSYYAYWYLNSFYSIKKHFPYLIREGTRTFLPTSIFLIIIWYFMASRLHIIFAFNTSEVRVYLTIMTRHTWLEVFLLSYWNQNTWHFSQLMPFRYDVVHGWCGYTHTIWCSRGPQLLALWGLK